MKLTLAFTLLCIIHISANTYAQTTQVSIDVKNGTFYDVVKQVEKQSEYLFFYNSKDIPNDLPFSLQKTKSNITVILDYLVEKYDLSYKIDDRQIFLTKNAVIQQQQGKRITGIVKEPNGEPIIGANVMEKGTTNGTITDVDGKFSLEVFSDNATVIISYIGYLSNAVSIKGQSVFNITLKEDSQSLEEVVVVGYGTQKKATLTGAVSNIGNEELIKTRSENVKNMISGKIPGVRVVQKSGEPGSYNTDMQIRGMGTPLVIIDGVPRSNMDRLDPNEIESFSVLKDASAAIYGVKAANGVVIITTKRGKTPKLTLDYNGSVGWQQASNIPETLNAAQWMELTNENAINQGRSLMFTQEDIDQYRMGLKPETKWSDVGFDKIAPQTQHSISAQGKSDKIDYFMNFGYMKQDGFYSSGDLNYERYNVRTNINGQITKNLKVGMQLNGMMGTKNEPIMDAWEVYKAAWMHIPTLPVYANNNPAYLQQLPGAYHPIALTTADISGARKNHQKLFQSTFTLDYAVPFIKGLNVGAMYSYDYDSSDNRYSRKEYALYEYDAVADSYQPFKAYSPSRINRSYYKDEKTLLQLKLNYERTFKEIHNLKVLFLYEETTHKTDNFAAQRDLPMDAVDEI
ncbi:SusC/RagA family TonB-linked outer membrane protein, partial [Parabacteroides leei]